MSKQTNGLQSKATRVGDGLLGTLGERVTATEFSAAVVPTVFWGTITDVLDRELAGLSLINLA